jgi:hypothetical protein
MKQHRSAASLRQSRWRKNTSLRRVELCLAPEAMESLDDLVREHGASGRAAVVERIIAGEILSPLLVDVRRELLVAYQALLRAILRHYVRAEDVTRIMGAAVQKLEQCGGSR